MGDKTTVENGSSILYPNIVQLAQFLKRLLRPRDRNAFERDVRIDTNRANGISNSVTSLIATLKSYVGRMQKDSSDGDNSQKTASDKRDLPEFDGKRESLSPNSQAWLCYVLALAPTLPTASPILGLLVPCRHAAQNFQKVFAIGQAVTNPHVPRNATTQNTAETIVETL